MPELRGIGRAIGLLGCAAALTMVAPPVASANVFAWGSNGNAAGAQVAGALGTGTGQSGPGDCTKVPGESANPWPVQLPPHTQVSAVAAGLNRGYAVTPAGRVVAWGDYGTGRRLVDNPSLTCVPGLVDVHGSTGDVGEQLNVTSVAPTVKGTIFVDSETDPNLENGAGSSAGTNVHGELLSGSVDDPFLDLARRNSLGGYPAARRPYKVVSGVASSIVLDVNAGTITAWGSDAHGEHGDGGGSADAVGDGVAVPLPAGSFVKQVAAGPHFALALTSDGKVYGWGADESGQLGDGQRRLISNVVRVPLPAGATITQIAAGGDPGLDTGNDADGFGLALSSAGVVYGWGANTRGQLANGSTTADAVAPRPITNLPAGLSIKQLAAGPQQGFVVTTDGALYSWGGRQLGLLGRVRSADDPTPRAVFTGSYAGTQVQSIGVQAVSHSAYALTSDLIAVSPTITLSAQDTSASLVASVTVPEGAAAVPTRCGFTTYKGDVDVPCTPAAGGTVQFGGTLTGFTPADVLDVRAYVTGGVPQTYGAYGQFVTSAPAPAVTTAPASNIGVSSASLGGTVAIAPGQRAFTSRTNVTCEFQYSTDPNLQTDVATVTVPAAAPYFQCVNPDNTLRASIDRLAPSTTYYYRTVFRAPQVFAGPAYGNIVWFTTGSNAPSPPPPPPGPGPDPRGPAVGPVGPGPTPGPVVKDRLSPTTCSNQTRTITAAGGNLKVTGCFYGDNAGHYVVEGTLTMNGITISASGNRQAKPAASFACDLNDTSCGTLLKTYAGSPKPELIIDVENLKVAGNGSYKLATGSTTLFDGALTSPDDPTPGATFDPEASGQGQDSGPAIYLAPGTGSSRYNLHGLPLVGPVVVAPQDTGGALLSLQVGVPSFEDIVTTGSLSGGSSTATGSATLAVSSTGAENLRALAFEVANLSIPKTSINLGTVGFSFNLDTNSWTAQTGFRLPGIEYRLGVKIVIENGAFKSIDGSVEDLGYVIPATGGAAVLDAIRAGFAFKPLTITGGLTLTGGPKIGGEAALSLDANFRLALGGSADIKSAFTPGYTYHYDNVPLALNLAGELTLVEGLPLEVPLGSANATLLAGTREGLVLAFSGGLGPLGGSGCDPQKPTAACTPQGYKLTVGGVTLASVNLGVDGLLRGGTSFNAKGYGSVNFLGANLSAVALISTVGIAACGSIGLPQLRSAAGVRATNTAPRPGEAAARAFATSAAAIALPRAAAAKTAVQRKRRIKQLQADSARTITAVRKLQQDTRRKIKAIVAADRRRTQRATLVASGRIKGAARGYTQGLQTSNRTRGALLTQAVDAAGALTAAGYAAQGQLDALRSDYATTFQALSQRYAADQAELKLLTGRPATTRTAGGRRAELRFSFSDLGNAIATPFVDAYNGAKDLAQTAAQKLESAVASAANAVRGAVESAASGLTNLTADARKAFTTAMTDFIAKAKVLGADAVKSLKAVAEIVRDGLVYVYNQVASALTLQVGVGYRWGGGAPSLYMGGGCSVGDFADNSGAFRAVTGASPTFALKAGPRSTILKFVGDGAPPLVTVTGPGGASFTTSTTENVSVQSGGNAVVIRDPTSNTTFVQFRPQTGTYTATLQPGSVRVTDAQQADQLPDPSVTATVSGTGTRRILRWSATAIKGQTLTFTVSGGAQVVATSSAAKGSKAFTVPAGLPGTGTVSVQVKQDGIDRQSFDVATFPAPVAKPPAAPKQLSVKRTGRAVRATWAAVAGAASYDVQLSSTGGALSLVTLTKPGVTLPATLPADTVVVAVTAIDRSGRRGTPATRSVAGKAASACLAPKAVTVTLRARGALKSSAATLNGTPVAASRTGAKSLKVPLAGLTGRRGALVVKARTAAGRTLSGRHVFALCSGHRIAKRLVLPLR